MPKFQSIAIVIGLSLLAASGTATAAEPEGAGTSPAPQAEQSAGQDSAPSPAPRPRKRGGKLPEDVTGLQQAAIEAYEDGNYLRFVQATILLRNKRPYEPQYLVGLVVGTSLLGRQNTAYSYMHMMQQQGLSFDFNSTEDTQAIRGTEVYDYINDLLVRAGDPLGKAEVAFSLDERPSYPEAIVWDAGRERFLVGTVDNGAVLAVSPSGESETLLEPGIGANWWSVQGLAIDAGHNRLWLSSTALPGFVGLEAGALGQSVLIGFELDSLKPVERYTLPADSVPHVFGSVAVLANGDVYVIDRAVPLLYHKTSGGDALTPFLGNRELVGFRDIVTSEDGKRLYLADAALGILVVEPERQVSAMLTVPENLNLGGLSGLMVSGNALLVVQNGIRPQRLMRLDLDPTGMQVVDSRPIANAMPEFNFPSFGVVHDGSVYYLAGSNYPGAHDGPVVPLVMKSPVEGQEGIDEIAHRKFQEDTFGKD